MAPFTHDEYAIFPDFRLKVAPALWAAHLGNADVVVHLVLFEESSLTA